MTVPPKQRSSAIAIATCLFAGLVFADGFVRPPHTASFSPRAATSRHSSSSQASSLFDNFVNFLKQKQRDIVTQLEQMDGSTAKFSNDTWGSFSPGCSQPKQTTEKKTSPSGGVTRVIQGGNVIEKGACSFTLIHNATLTNERAAAIRSRQDALVNAGDRYSAAALSIVLHSRSPLVPTFRSDVRIFLVQQQNGDTLAWFGGGADLTPYYLNKPDISTFHQLYKQLADQHQIPGFDYHSMKRACDDYFYLPARSEHRGTGGIFFDDMEATKASANFVRNVADSWLPSWLPIVSAHRDTPYSDKQKQWQLLRRGRYLEFNLLYDRGVKFGLLNPNPRVEGVMVSAPPLIAWEYNHQVQPGSAEDTLMSVLKEPIDWA